MTTDTAPPTPATVGDVRKLPPISAAWIAGGVAWFGAGLIFAADGWRLTAASVIWFVSDLLLLAGLVGLRHLRLHGGSRAGSGAVIVAIFARLLFAAGEVATIVSGNDEGPLIPLGALADGDLPHRVRGHRSAPWLGGRPCWRSPDRHGPVPLRGDVPGARRDRRSPTTCSSRSGVCLPSSSASASEPSGRAPSAVDGYGLEVGPGADPAGWLTGTCGCTYIRDGVCSSPCPPPSPSWM